MSSISAGTTTTTGYVVSSDTTGALVLKTGASATTALTIDTSQNVGIGTGSPTNPLHIVSNTVSQLNVTALSGNTNAQINFEPTGTGIALIGPANNVAFAFRTNATERMRLDASGNLSINSTTARTKLFVASSNASDTITVGAVSGGFAVTNSNTNYGLQIGSFSTGNSWLQSMRMDGTATAYNLLLQPSGGNVGIGTTSPATKLEVSNGAITAGDTGTVLVGRYGSSFPSPGAGYFSLSTNNSDGDNGGLSINTLASGTLSERARIDQNGNLMVGRTTTVNNARFMSAGSSVAYGTEWGDTKYMSQMYFNSDYYIGVMANAALRELRLESNSGDAAAKITFYTGASGTTSERARIDSSGVLLVNRTSYIAGVGSACKLQVLGQQGEWSLGVTNGGSTQPYGILMGYGAVPNTANWPFFLGADSAATRFSVYSNGGIANYSANDVNLSDRREKKNFAPAKSYLDVICSIPVQTFNYIDQNMEDDDGLTLGVVAQDVQAVAPELVMESNWAKKDEEPKIRLSVYQTDLQYALMKCIQEQQDLIESLTQRIAALEGTS